MINTYHVTAIIGSTNTKSRTQVLADAIIESLSEQLMIEVSYVELSHLATQFGSVTAKEDLSTEALAALDSITQADLIVAASPVYKGSYTGLFKHLIDFIHPDALIDRPVLLAATGGSERHALVIEHQLRPLFAFFRAHTLPTAVYASEAELEFYTVSSMALQKRIHEAANQAARLLSNSHHLTERIQVATLSQ